MRSSRTITLFSERPEESQRPASFLVSILAHGAVIGLVTAGILFTPKIEVRTPAERYAVRRLDLNAPEPRLNGTAGSGVAYPGPRSKARARAEAGKQTAQQAALRLTAQVQPGPQTLLQPDIDSKLTLTQKIPVPTVLLSSPVKTVAKTIVPPKPEQPAAEVQPILELPNEELNVADRNISSTNLPSPAQPIVASTTSPVVVHGPEPVKPPPVTTSESPAPPTPAKIVSLSDLQMAKGTVTLPPVNSTVPKASQGGLTAGQAKAPSEAAKANPAPAATTGNRNGAKTGPAQGAQAGSEAANQPAAGHSAGKAATAGQGAGNAAAKPEIAGNAGAKPESSGNGNGARPGPAQGAEGGSGGVNLPGTERITLSKDGQFGAVVVGSSLEEKFPETAGLLGGRMAYTVYLHVGLAKSWILQYSLPRSEDAASAGNISRLEAPWPYNIVRPNITPGMIDADALMVHGFVNQTGHFEGLAVVFPPEFAQTEFVLKSLALWQFRPATQNGQIARVEVLLIIPEVLE